MNIWIDISHTPHVNFFKQLIQDWKKEGHSIIITARPLSNTIPLLEKHKIDFHEVGRHYGKNKLAKVVGFFIRCFQLWKFLRNKNIDVAISQSSYYSPLVAKMLRCNCIYTNDNEFAKGNYVGFVFAQKILLPAALEEWAKSKFFNKRVTYYPGVKEGIYLHNVVENIKESRKTEDNRHIFFRPEAWAAEYHRTNKNDFSLLMSGLAEKFKVTILPRCDDQIEFFNAMNNPSIKVQDIPLSLIEIVEQCDVFIGGGGSMSREFSFLGVKTLSTYQSELLAVDKYLIEMNVMTHLKNIDPQTVMASFALLKSSSVNSELQESGIRAYDLIERSIHFKE
jgi:uncharacterized protein